MDFRILGPLQVLIDDKPVHLGGPRQQAVLVVLLLRANQLVSIDQLADEVWHGTPPAGAANTLHGYVFHLRKVLEPSRTRGAQAEVLISESGGYRLNVRPDSIDAARFERLADAGRRLSLAGDAGGARRSLESALDIWRGEPLTTFGEIEAVGLEARRLTDRRLQALEDLSDALLAVSDLTGVLAVVEDGIAEDPWREHLWSQRMLALYRLGRQAEALVAYGEIRKRMLDELGLDPGPDLQTLEAQILNQDPTLEPQERKPVNTSRTGLPATVTSFIGRGREVERVRECLDYTRLVTIIGAGGVGKTRLAIESLQDIGPRFEAIWFVDLGSIERDDLVLASIAEAISREVLADTTDIAEHIGSRSALLVLDNCEHLISAVADAGTSLLASCPQLSIVATSREALAIDGEQLIALAPLAVPVGDVLTDPNRVLESPAVELFTARARSNDRDFDPLDDLDAVVEICTALDGVPLAIELAAARLRSLPIDELADRIEDRFRILTGGSRARVSRQRTLESAVAWSYNLLDDLERPTFVRLSVFTGGFTLSAAEAVAAADPVDRHDIIDLLGHLVDKSLLILEPGTGRYRMLETIRTYGTHRLAEDALEVVSTRRRHARWCAEFVGERSGRLIDGSDPTAIEDIDREAPNLRSALAWALDVGEDNLGVSLAAGLGSWWEMRGLLAEGRTALERALEHVDADELTLHLAELGLGSIARRQGDYETAASLTRRALDGLRELGATEHLATEHLTTALGRMAWVALGRGDAVEAVELANEGLAVADAQASNRATPWMHLALGHAAHQLDDIDDAVAHLELARSGFERGGSRSGLGRSLFHLCLIELERNKIDSARSAAAAAIEVNHGAHDLNGTIMALEAMVQVASAGLDDVRAITLGAAARSLRETFGALDSGGLARVEQAVAAARERLGQADADKAEVVGSVLDLDGAVTLSLGE
ncbi:MAG: hypothetical protein GY708_27750 [Actinomycetia bacterium]|nr:hypothetical protein [Actinomycetes bacterium]